jgi:hypothetical protein
LDGDGLNYYFFGNENFMGNKKSSESEIKMDSKFSRADPAILDFENFSLEMDGFVKAPADS